MVDTQNTVAGGGGNIITEYGNKFIDSLSGLADVGAKLGDVYSSFQESKETNRIEEAQKVAVPNQTIPSYQVTSAADFLSDPQRVKTAAVYGVIGILAIGALIIIAKKA